MAECQTCERAASLSQKLWDEAAFVRQRIKRPKIADNYEAAARMIDTLLIDHRRDCPAAIRNLGATDAE